MRWIARSDTPEIFTAASLLLVVATAALMESVGLSMALGAFLAGVLLAESEYRRELETDLEPFKGLLLGLFFIAVGMSIDFAVVLARPGLVAAVVAGFLLLKALVLLGMARLLPVPLAERPVFVVLLAQGGEFGFVVFQAASPSGVIDAEAASLLVAAVALSMLLTPLLLVLVDRWLTPRLARAGAAQRPAEISEPQQAPIIIAGFGRYGQIVGRLLNANGLSATVLEHDADQVETVRRFGWPVFYGDATRLDLLRTAGAGKARVLVLAIDDIDQSVAVARLAREHFPQLQMVARARNVTHYYRLRELGVTLIERETLDSALDERAQRARADGLAAPHRAQSGAALSPAQHRADGAHGAALRRREEADRAVQAGARAVGGAMGGAATAAERAAGARRLALAARQRAGSAPSGRRRGLTPAAALSEKPGGVSGRRAVPSRQSASA